MLLLESLRKQRHHPAQGLTFAFVVVPSEQVVWIKFEQFRHRAPSPGANRGAPHTSQPVLSARSPRLGGHFSHFELVCPFDSCTTLSSPVQLTQAAPSENNGGGHNFQHEVSDTESSSTVEGGGRDYKRRAGCLWALFSQGENIPGSQGVHFVPPSLISWPGLHCVDVPLGWMHWFSETMAGLVQT